MLHTNLCKISFTHREMGGILSSLLILLFFVTAVGLPIVLFVFVVNDGDSKLNRSRLIEKTKPPKLSKLESEASRKKDKKNETNNSNVENPEDTSVNENLKLAGLWKKHYKSLEILAKNLENSKIVIDDDMKYAEILSQYKKNKMLKIIYNDEKLSAYITQELKDNLEKYIKIIGDYLSIYKKSYVLRKVNVFIEKLAYDDALAYIKDVLEGKFPYDMPKSFIENKTSGVAGISRKDRELEKYWFENENIINAEKEFRANSAYFDVLQFKSNLNVNISKIIDYDKAFMILEKLDKFNINFNNKYADANDVKPIADKINTCINDMTSIILNSINSWLIELDDNQISQESKKAILLDFISKLKTKFNLVEKYNAEIALKLWDSLISVLQATDEPKKTISLDYDAMEKMLTHLQSELETFAGKSVTLNLDDITILESRLTEILDESLMAGWITDNYIPEKSGIIHNSIEMVENKIFKLLYDCTNSQEFKDRKFRKEWTAWGIVFQLIWKPGESRFGTNIDKMMKIKNIEYRDDDFANACIILESISANLYSKTKDTTEEEVDNAFYMTNIYRAVGHIERITYDLFQLMKDKANGSEVNLSPEKIASMEKLSKILRFNIIQTVKMRTNVEGSVLSKLLKNSINNLADVYDFLLENLSINNSEDHKYKTEQKLMNKFEQMLITE